MVVAALTRRWAAVVGSGVAAGCGNGQSRQEMLPAVGVTGQLGFGQSGVDEIDPRAVFGGGQPEVDRGRALRQVLAARDTPGNDHARRAFDVQILTSDREAGDVDRE